MLTKAVMNTMKRRPNRVVAQQRHRPREAVGMWRRKPSKSNLTRINRALMRLSRFAFWFTLAYISNVFRHFAEIATKRFSHLFIKFKLIYSNLRCSSVRMFIQAVAFIYSNSTIPTLFGVQKREKWAKFIKFNPQFLQPLLSSFLQ